ncbi:unnamed protein product [Alopecurus aequalis]
MATTASLPCLVLDHGDEQRTTTLYSVSDGARRPCEEIGEELRGKRSWVTSHGWLLLWDPATLATFLWDPRAAAFEGDNKKIALHAWASPPEAGTGCALSGDPTDPDGFTVVVLESSASSDDTALWYCHAGGTLSSPWARHVYDIGGTWVPWDKDFFAKHYVPGFGACRGKFYCNLSKDKYGVLEFSPEPALTTVKMKEAVEIIVPPGQCYSTPFSYTLDLDGEVHTAWVFFSDSEAGGAVLDIAVYRMDLAAKRPVRVENIGDRAILAGGSDCYFAGWCPATESGLLPNSVYWMHPDESRLYVYDVGANTKQVRELGEGAEPSRLPFWIVPRK